MFRKSIFKPLGVGLALGIGVGSVTMSVAQQDQAHSHHGTADEARGVVQIPHPMVVAHDALHGELEAAMEAGGRTAEAAREVEKHLMPHFNEENRVALPPLGVLRALVREGATEEMRPAIEMARQVEESLDHFLEEHEAIGKALDKLEEAAEAEGKGRAAAFARDLRLHAQEEEEVLYPATILIGRYLQQELGPPAQDNP